MRSMLGAVMMVGLLASCAGDGDEIAESSAAAATTPSQSIAYSYTPLPSYPVGGLTATNVKAGIDQSAAVGYAALQAADDALAAAKQYTDEQLAACPSTCQGSVATVQRRDPDGTCVVNFRYPCVPYRCDADHVTCGNVCLSDADCAQGASCDTATGECAEFGAICKDDFTVEDSNGQIESCIPYKCVAGVCQQQCQTSNDCYDGYQCSGNFCAAI